MQPPVRLASMNAQQKMIGNTVHLNSFLGP
jgi:hypothetical protein